MNKVLLLILSIIPLLSYSQEFIFDEKGLQPQYQVVEIDSMSQKELFDKAVNWIKENYVNPDEVIKTTIDNEKVRFMGSKDYYLCLRGLLSMCYDVRYTIELSFKDGKYKFAPVNLKYFTPSSKYFSAGWNTVPLSGGYGYYKKNGKLKNMFQEWPTSIQSLFNDINLSLKLYMTTDQSVKEEKW